MAVGLYGHRNRFDENNPDVKTSIDPVKLFGNIDEFVSLLKERGLDKVVIITEENSSDPNKITSLPLARLKDGVFGHENFDLYEYFKELSDKNVQVTVLSGDTRPPVSALGKKLYR